MPLPPNVISLEKFREQLRDKRALKANLDVQDHFCWWCGDYSVVLIPKYWHGFCSQHCWKAYRDSRL